MRKQSKRQLIDATPMLSPEQHTKIMIIPHLHLDLMLRGNATLTHAQSVVGLLNLGSALAFLKKDAERQAMVHHGLRAVLACTRRATNGAVPAPTTDERDTILATMQMVDRWIGVQRTGIIQRALNFVVDAQDGKKPDLVEVLNRNS